MQQHKLPAEPSPTTAGAWYRQPVIWLGAAILAASLAGCVWMIVLGARYADRPLQGNHQRTLFDMPVRDAEPAKTGSGPRDAGRDTASPPAGAPAGATR
jgi:hypothetical protein